MASLVAEITIVIPTIAVLPVVSSGEVLGSGVRGWAYDKSIG